jgi:hypothetical protein
LNVAGAINPNLPQRHFAGRAWVAQILQGRRHCLCSMETVAKRRRRRHFGWDVPRKDW